MLASHGYAVLMPNPRGSDGQGLQFAEAVKGDWGGGDFQDVLDGVDALIKQQVIDASRLGIGGWSYGGFMSAWAVTHTDRFKAAVVGAAPVDLSSMTLTTDTPDFLPGYFGDVIANHAAYEAHSSVRMIDRVHTPVLILHGEQDQRVPISQGQQFYIGLRELGRPVQMVRYPREPHWIHEYEHEKDILARVLNWFDSHL
jgi:dipeptidyl aminopeptidase/acylaminoacyl peptidase